MPRSNAISPATNFGVASSNGAKGTRLADLSVSASPFPKVVSVASQMSDCPAKLGSHDLGGFLQRRIVDR